MTGWRRRHPALVGAAWFVAIALGAFLLVFALGLAT